MDLIRRPLPHALVRLLLAVVLMVGASLPQAAGGGPTMGHVVATGGHHDCCEDGAPVQAAACAVSCASLGCSPGLARVDAAVPLAHPRRIARPIPTLFPTGIDPETVTPPPKPASRS